MITERGLTFFILFEILSWKAVAVVIKECHCLDFYAKKGKWIMKNHMLIASESIQSSSISLRSFFPAPKSTLKFSFYSLPPKAIILISQKYIAMKIGPTGTFKVRKVYGLNC